MTRLHKKVSKSNDDQPDALARAALASASGYDRDLGISIMAEMEQPVTRHSRIGIICTKESEPAS